MVKFNTYDSRGQFRPAIQSAVTTETTPSGTTAMGGHGYAYDPVSELFLLSVNYLTPHDPDGKFHETGMAQDSRFVELVRAVALTDPQWGLWFLEYLRLDTFMRTAAIIGGCEFAKARLDADKPGYARDVIDVVCQRADEPGEVVAYWFANFGKAIPTAVKRGLAQACWRLYTERAILKWDSPDKPIRAADVIGLVRPTGLLRNSDEFPVRGTPRADLYEWLRRDRFTAGHVWVPNTLPMIKARRELMALPVEKRNAAVQTWRLRSAGMTHEALAGWLERPMTAWDWEQIIPSMGVMALVRNLNNFTRANINDAAATKVAEVLSDRDAIRKSRMLPMQLLTSYRVQETDRFRYPLDQAINHALDNIPQLGGYTLVMVDTSSSMENPLSRDHQSDRHQVKRWDAAALFGIALGRRCETADVVSFSSNQVYRHDPPGPRTKLFALRAGESLLHAVTRWGTDGYFLGGGTATAAGLRAHVAPHHTRVVVITDEQAGIDPVGVDRSVPAHVPMYTINVAGYPRGHAPAGSRNRHTFGGLTDNVFTLLRLIEAGQRADWPAIFNTARKARVTTQTTTEAVTRAG